MNILLQFKKKSHSEAYSHDLQLQVTKRLIMVIIWALTHIGEKFAVLGIYGSVTMSSLDISKMTMIFVLVAALAVLRCNLRRARKYQALIDIILDLCLIYGQFVFYPLVGKGTLDIFTRLGNFAYGWVACLACYSIYFAIANWWLKVIVPLVQVACIVVPAVQLEHKLLSPIIIILACECLVLYGGFIYVYEYFRRRDFLEKRKVYENYEAVMRIFDDIIQGVMIVDPNYKLIYSNRTIGSMFSQAQNTLALESLFSQIQVKSIHPQLDILITERIQMTQDETEAQNTLKEYMEIISKVLFHPNSPEPSITAETIWWDLTDASRPEKKNFSIKFTTSLFMEKNVIVINITDTTDRDSLIAAQAASDYKSRLLSSVSHELRTPLNGSINFIEESLFDTTIPSTTKDKWLIPALRSNRLLLSLVNDILDFSQMHAGKLRLVFESRSVVDTAKECLELVEIQAKKKALKLALENNVPSDHEMLVTDHNRVRQVILNILSNAVKFTFDGGVTLILDPTKIEVPHQNQSEGTYILKGVRVTCKDTGIGISAEDQKKLFKAFEKIDLGAKAFINSTGAGLGLLISNSLVQKLSPENLPLKDSNILRFESKVDEGSSFSFTIYHHDEKSGNVKHIDLDKSSPGEFSVFSEHGLEMRNIEELSRPAVSFSLGNRYSSQGLILRESKTPGLIQVSNILGSLMSIPSQAQINCKCPRVLIVDDDPFNLTALDQILKRLQIPCHWAFNGKEAIEKIEARKHNRCGASCRQYKVMFLDCNMPILDGFETARRLRQMENKGEVDRITIIACTAFVQQSDEKRAREAGMDDFSTKPIKFSVIKEKLKANGFYDK